MIVFNKIQEYQECNIYYKDDLIGAVTNELEFNDVRIQIAKQKLEGYSVEFNGERIPIRSNGRLPKWPKGMYDFYESQLCKLISAGISE